MNRPDCRCGHAAVTHEKPGLAPQCTAAACACLEYRSSLDQPQRLERRGTAHTPLAAVKPPLPADIRASQILDRTVELIHEAKQRTPRIRRLAEKIEEELAHLRDLVERDAESAAARQEIAELTAKLAAAKAKIRLPKKTDPAKKPVVSRAAGKHDCPDCERSFLNPQGLGAHRARAHGYRRSDGAA